MLQVWHTYKGSNNVAIFTGCWFAISLHICLTFLANRWCIRFTIKKKNETHEWWIDKKKLVTLSVYRTFWIFIGYMSTTGLYGSVKECEGERIKNKNISDMRI